MRGLHVWCTFREGHDLADCWVCLPIHDPWDNTAAVMQESLAKVFEFAESVAEKRWWLVAVSMRVVDGGEFEQLMTDQKARHPGEWYEAWMHVCNTPLFNRREGTFNG